MTDNIESPDLQWSPQIDSLLAKWCDQAKCFEFMHEECYSMYNSKSRNFIITMTILSTISGASNIIAGSYSIYGFQASWIFGGLGVIASLAHILQDKLAYQQLSESNRQYCDIWGSLRRKIEAEIILPYNSRKDCSSFLELIRNDIDSVSKAGSSIIPKKIREECLEKFKNISNFNIPDICGIVEHTTIYTRLI